MWQNISRKGNSMSYEIKYVHGHYEIYINGKFYCTADNMAEVEEELEKAL